MCDKKCSKVLLGSLVVAGVVLSKTVCPNCIYISAFVGVMMILSGLFGCCPIKGLLSKFGCCSGGTCSTEEGKKNETKKL